MTSAPTPSIEPIPYRIMADCFKNRVVVPFLGAAASFVGADPSTAVPGGVGLARFFAECGHYPGSSADPLTKITQFIEEIPADRDFLLSKIESIFYTGLPDGYRSSVTEFLKVLPVGYIPRLIITTNYDVLIERILESRGLPYFAISHIMRNSRYAGRFLCYKTLDQSWTQCILTRTQLEETLMTMSEDEPDTSLVYKMHGTARLKARVNEEAAQDFVDSIVLTESDYVEFLEDDRLNKVPTRVLDFMRRSNLLFLGYSLEDWNFRVLLQRLHRIQVKQKQSRKRHWACRLMEQPDEVERRFWNLRGVELYPVSLDMFLERLMEQIRQLSPSL